MPSIKLDHGSIVKALMAIILQCGALIYWIATTTSEMSFVKLQINKIESKLLSIEQLVQNLHFKVNK